MQRVLLHGSRGAHPRHERQILHEVVTHFVELAQVPLDLLRSLLEEARRTVVQGCDQMLLQPFKLCCEARHELSLRQAHLAQAPAHRNAHLAWDVVTLLDSHSVPLVNKVIGRSLQGTGRFSQLLHDLLARFYVLQASLLLVLLLPLPLFLLRLGIQSAQRFFPTEQRKVSRLHQKLLNHLFQFVFLGSFRCSHVSRPLERHDHFARKVLSFSLSFCLAHLVQQLDVSKHIGFSFLVGFLIVDARLRPRVVKVAAQLKYLARVVVLVHISSSSSSSSPPCSCSCSYA
mmetsp:Transcript_13879/g.26661  ORF Transcript_13879/g.26661 Transcript_13879/m.26661 type:complete len:287 (-) Transcript_13879:238-1098(-)